MVEIINKLNQRLTINLKSGTLELLGRSTAVVSDDDFSSTHLQNLLGSGKIILVSQKEDKSKKKSTPKKVDSSEGVVHDSEEKKESGSETGETDMPEGPGKEEKLEESPESGQPENEAEQRIQERKKTSTIKRRK
jgi:hypothetical protein